MKKQQIQVHQKGVRYGTPGAHVETIMRKLYAEQCGNFNPVFCTYKGKRFLVQSTQGDLSDPFRRDESYLNNLFIELNGR